MEDSSFVRPGETRRADEPSANGRCHGPACRRVSEAALADELVIVPALFENAIRVDAPGPSGADAVAAQSARRLLLFAGAVWTVAILFTNVFPTILEMLREALALDENQMGSIGSAYVLGHGLVVASGPFWVRRVPVVALCAAAMFLAAASLVFMSMSPTSGALVAGWLVVGIATGLIGTPTFAILGNSPDPTRVFSIALFGSTLVAALVSFALPRIDILQGFVLLAAGFALSSPLVLGLRSHRLRAAPDPAFAGSPAGKDARINLAAPLLAMASGSIMLGTAWGGVYNFVGVIGAAGGLEVHGAGGLVVAGLAGALAGSIGSAFVGTRLGSPLAMISLAIGGVILTFPAMIQGERSMLLGALVVQGALTTSSLAYLLGIVREFDASGRAYIAFPAIQALGTAAATKFTGWYLAQWTVSGFLWVASGLMALSWLILVAAGRLHGRSQPAS